MSLASLVEFIRVFVSTRWCLLSLWPRQTKKGLSCVVRYGGWHHWQHDFWEAKVVGSFQRMNFRPLRT